MRLLTLATLSVALARSTSAAATPPAGVTDTTILQYALTLEHLENAFYEGALAMFNKSQFDSTGVEQALFEQIAAHENTHVQILTSVLGAQAPAACNYSFPYTDVQSFKGLAQILEGVGVTAYLGAAQFISTPALLTAAGSILTTEARHAAWLASSVNGNDPWSGAFDTPLSFNDVFSLAAPFITSCPSSNPPLPFKAFPALTLNGTNGNLVPGSSITLTVPPSVNASSMFLVFLVGTSQTAVSYTANQTVTIPNSVNSTGTIYAVVTKENATVSDDITLAGPAILMYSAQFPSGVSTSTAPGSTGGSSSGGSSASSSSGSSSTGAATLNVRGVNSAVLMGLVALMVKFLVF